MNRANVWTAGLGVLLALTGAVAVMAQGGDRASQFRDRGQALFQQRCASCHDPASGRAPARADLGRYDPDDIVKALKTGPMAPMASGLGELDIASISFYLTGRAPGLPVAQVADPPPCATPDAFAMTGPAWNGWSIDRRNWRLQPDPGLAAADLPKLKVKWSMTYVGGRYGQPTVVGGRLFLTSSGGRVYSLDAASGCLRWRFDVPGGARSTVVVGPLAAAPSGYGAYFGDLKRNVYALDAGTGALVWKTSIEAHPLALVTGSPALYQGRLYVPLSSVEEATAGAADYGCCTARGALAALDAATGKLIWKTYTIAQTPAATRKNAAGTQMFGPAGGAVWSTPTIDARRGVALIATGDSYTDTPTDGADAVIALDLATGAVRWKTQVTTADNFLAGCAPGRRLVNCPTTIGPDADFGASPILLTLPSGRDIVLAGQKSGLVFGMDPDHGGKLLWRVRVGAGGPLGGIEWGMASDGHRLYVANADPFSPTGGARPGLSALDPADGAVAWSAPTPKPGCSWPAGLRCFNAQSAAPSVIPGLVLATTTDGHLRAYDIKDGRIVWDFDTAGQTYATLNGVTGQRGGSLDVAGPTVAGGMLFLISGYQGPMGGVPNNVLLAMSVDGK